jgi:hypothetical protein
MAASKLEGDGVQTGNACIVCWRSPTDRAHVIDRSLARDPYSDPARVVYLCREHHDAYDNHTLDLLPYLEPRHRHELARAVELVGLITTLERVTGCTWSPDREETAIARDIMRASGGLAP